MTKMKIFPTNDPEHCGIHSFLEPASSGPSRKCSFWYFHNGLIFQLLRGHLLVTHKKDMMDDDTTRPFIKLTF